MSKKNKIFDSVETLVGSETTLKGTILSSKTVRVDGQIIGDIEKASGVVVGKTATIKGNIKADYVVVAGKVEGNIISTDGIELLDKSSVIGNIQTKIISISEGAFFDGKSTMIKNDTTKDNQQLQEDIED